MNEHLLRVPRASDRGVRVHQRSIGKVITVEGQYQVRIQLAFGQRIRASVPAYLARNVLAGQRVWLAWERNRWLVTDIDTSVGQQNLDGYLRAVRLQVQDLETETMQVTQVQSMEKAVINELETKVLSATQGQLGSMAADSVQGKVVDARDNFVCHGRAYSEELATPILNVASSRVLKQNIQNAPADSQALLSMQSRHWQRRGKPADMPMQRGFIAEEVAAVNPGVVNKSNMQLNVMAMVSQLVDLCQNQEKRIRILEKTLSLTKT